MYLELVMSAKSSNQTTIGRPRKFGISRRSRIGRRSTKACLLRANSQSYTRKYNSIWLSIGSQAKKDQSKSWVNLDRRATSGAQLVPLEGFWRAQIFCRVDPWGLPKVWSLNRCWWTQWCPLVLFRLDRCKSGLDLSSNFILNFAIASRFWSRTCLNMLRLACRRCTRLKSLYIAVQGKVTRTTSY